MHDLKNNYQDEHPRVRGKEAIAQVLQPTPSADWLDKLPIEATPPCSMLLLLLPDPELISSESRKNGKALLILEAWAMYPIYL
jgi:hypothetical protein